MSAITLTNTAEFLIGNHAENIRVSERRSWDSLRETMRIVQAEISACIVDAIADVQDWTMENDLI